MRRILLLFSLTAHIAVYGQWKIGVGGGLSLNHYKYQQQDWKYQFLTSGLAFDIHGQYDFNKNIGIRADFCYTQKNTIQVLPLYGDDTAYKTKNGYIQLPIMATGTLKWGNYKPFINAGLYGAYWVSSSVSSKMEVGELPEINSNYSNRFDFGLVGGLGIEYYCTNHISVIIEARCFYSTVSLKKEIKGIKNPQYHTTFVIQPSICYTF